MIIELRGEHHNPIKRIDTDDYPLCVGIYFEVKPIDCRREHFAHRPAYPAWDKKRKVSDLPEPPAEVR